VRRWNNARSQKSVVVPVGTLKPWAVAIVLSLLVHSGLFAVIAVKSYLRQRTEAAALPIGTSSSRVEFFDSSGDDGGGDDKGLAAGQLEVKASIEQVAPPSVAKPETPQPTSGAVPEPPAVAVDASTAPPTDAPAVESPPKRELHASVDVPSSTAGGSSGTSVETGDGNGDTSSGGRTGGRGATAAYGRNPLPPYPREAREHGWQGTALLRVEVLANGSAGKIEVAESSGHAILDKVSMQTVQDWMFRPARSGDAPVPSVVEIPITFRLE
jgi:periplasmic protein TonB